MCIDRLSRCGRTFECANGYTTSPCDRPKGHRGRCTGFITGGDSLGGTAIKWDGRYDTEEQEYYKHQVNFDVDINEEDAVMGEEVKTSICLGCAFIAEGWSRWMFTVNGVTYTRDVYADGNEWALDRLIKIYGEEHADAIMNGHEICPVCGNIHIVPYIEKIHNKNDGGLGNMKNRKWLLEAQLISGKGVNQIKVGELMGDFREEDTESFKETVSTLIAAGEVKEYTENVFLRLGEYEGATKEEAYNNYFEAFDGDDHNELFFMSQIDAIELAVDCGCGGNCSATNNKFEFVADDETIAEAIDSGELFIQEKITAWNETRVKLKETDTLESVKTLLLESGYSSEWDIKSREMIPESEEFMEGKGTFIVTNRNNVKLGSN